MTAPAAFVLGLGLGSLLICPLCNLVAAALAHEHPLDRTREGA